MSLNLKDSRDVAADVTDCLEKALLHMEDDELNEGFSPKWRSHFARRILAWARDAAWRGVSSSGLRINSLFVSADPETPKAKLQRIIGFLKLTHSIRTNPAADLTCEFLDAVITGIDRWRFKTSEPSDSCCFDDIVQIMREQAKAAA